MNDDLTKPYRSDARTRSPPRWYRVRVVSRPSAAADGTPMAACSASCRPCRSSKATTSYPALAEPEADSGRPRHRRGFARQRCCRSCAAARCLRCSSCRSPTVSAAAACCLRRSFAYTVTTALTALAPNTETFVVLQFLRADVRGCGEPARDGRHRRRVRARKSRMGNRRRRGDSGVRRGIRRVDVRLRRRVAVRLARAVRGRRDSAAVSSRIGGGRCRRRAASRSSIERAHATCSSRCRCSRTSGAPRANIRDRLWCSP